MATHVHTCQPRDGWNWLVEGLQLFKRKPGEMFLLGNTYLFVLLFIGLIVPVLGGPLMTLITPGLGAGIMIASKMASQGMKITPTQLFSGFMQNNRKHVQPLLTLGAVFTVCFAIIKFLAFLLLGPQPAVDMSQMEHGGVNAQDMSALIEYMMMYSAFVMAASVPVVLLFWFAPALVIWHEMSAWKALFASWIAAWRNKSTFLIYGMGWVTLTMGFAFIVAGIFAIFGAPMMLVVVINIFTSAVIMGATFCTYYPSYKAVFEHDPHHLDITI